MVIMKRYGLLIAALLAAAVWSCTEIIKPEQREIPDETPAIDGLWASLDAENRTDVFVAFYMGKYFSYSCGGLHVVDDNKIWNCSRDDCLVKEIRKYAVSDGTLLLDGESAGKVTFDEDGKILSLALDETEYTRFDQFTDESHATEIVSGVTLDMHSLGMIPGGKTRLTATVLPEITFQKKCFWQSSSPSVVTVDDDGLVTALNPGQAEVTVTTKVGGFVDNCHVVVDTDLSAGGRANCYIVPSSGWFSFDAGYKGNSDTAIEGGAEAIVLWCSGVDTADKDLDSFISLSSYDPESRRISFYATGTNGNVVIALRDKDGKILWSWHIWICMDFDPDLTAQAYYNDAGVVMDRNLGALSLTYGNVSNFGLSYQWGRKDPFPGSSARTSGKNSSAKMISSLLAPGYSWETGSSIGSRDAFESNPTVDFTSGYGAWSPDADELWSAAAKSVYDPCPAGWRVCSGGPDGVLAKALGVSGVTSLPNFTFNYYKDAVNLHSVAGDSEIIWYQYIGHMTGFQYNAMGWHAYYWTRTLHPSSSTSGLNGRKAYSFHIDRNGTSQDVLPQADVSCPLTLDYACPLRCEKDEKK